MTAGSNLPASPTTDASLSVYPRAIAVSAATNSGGPPPPPPVTFTVDNPDADTYYYAISYEGTAIGSAMANGLISTTYNTTNRFLGSQQTGYAIGATLTGSLGTSDSVYDMYFVTPAMLGAGTYHDKLKIWVCYDAACSRMVSGSPKSVAVTYTVTGEAIPDSGITVYSPVTVETPSTHDAAAASVILEAENLPPYGAYVFAKPRAGGLIAAAKFKPLIGAGPATQYGGTVELTLQNPDDIGAGIRSEAFDIDVCFDSACTKQAVGSPFRVDLNYVVDPVEGKEFVQKRMAVIPGGMVWDATTQRIYAVLPADSPHFPNTLARIDPFTATVEKAVQLDGGARLEPGTLAVSDDGLFLFVAVADGSGLVDHVERIRTSNMGLDLTITLPPASVVNVATIQPAPKDAHLLLVGLIQTDPELYLYQDAAQVGPALSGTQGGPVSSYAWGASESGMYAYLPDIVTGTLETGAVSSKGIKITHRKSSAALADLNVTGDIRYIDGLLFWDGGATFDPATGKMGAPFDFFASTNNLILGGSPDFDTAGDRAYFVTDDQPPNEDALVTTIEAFTLSTRAARWLVRFRSQDGASELLRWGTDGLAFFDNTGASPSLVLISGAIVTQ